MSNLDNSEIMQLAKDGRADELLDDLRQKCLAPVGGLYYFSKVVLGYKELVPHYHLPFANKIQTTMHERRRGFLRPRGHFKSTIAAKSYPLWRLCGGGWTKDKPDPRNLRFLIVGESADVAQKDIKDPRWNIENNQLLRVLFPQIIPTDFKKCTWRDDAIEISRPSSFDEATITAAGVGAKVTGTHYDVLLYDDIIGEKAAKSDAVMNEAMEWFIYAAGLANDPNTVEELMIGTRWRNGRADLYGWIMEELKYSDENNRPTGFVWDVEGCYDKQGEPLFYPRFTKEVLASILQREKTYKFSCQYLNDPTAPEGSKFKESQIKTFKIVTDPGDGKKDLLVPSDGTPPVKLKHLARLSFYDPSSGGPLALSENAIACVGTASDNRKFAFKVWSKTCGFNEGVENWFRLNDQFFTWPNMFEAIGAHKEVGLVVSLRQAEGKCLVCAQLPAPGGMGRGKDVKHKRLNPEPVVPAGGSTQKDDRIVVFFQPDFDNGLIYIDEQDIQTRLQIIQFPFGELMDRLDALAYAVHFSRRPHTIDEIEAQEHDKQRHDIAHVQRTAQTYDVGGYI